MRSLRPFLLLIASVSFGLGISLPLMRFEKLYFFSETPSLIDIIADLWAGGELLLAAVVSAFSVLFPLAKLYAAFQSTISNDGASRWATALGKWSMVDVLLVAIVVFAAKTSGLANAFTQPGVWFFALSAIAVAISTIGVNEPKNAKRATW